MWFWLSVGVVMLLWGVATVVWLLDSVRNLNVMTVVGLWIATAAGFQATLGMRKADPADDL
jgi:hypothetical protein